MNACFKIDDIELNTSFGAPTGFSVVSVPKTYMVYFTDCIVSELKYIFTKEKHPIILIDHNVYELYFSKNDLFAGYPTIQIPALEDKKNIDTVLSIVSELDSFMVDKSNTLIVIGGGILQDIGAFVAAIYKRGMPWIYIPTTLLSQADSCVGGKTALNHNNHKNTLALFSAPKAVYIDVDFIKTLSVHDFESGVGEIVRLCLTGGNGLVEYLKGDVDNKQLIYNSLMIKRAVVEYDEFEQNIRKSMNYGHSIGHALEAYTKYAIPHGVAVMLGILVENEISYRLGYLSLDDKQQIHALISTFLAYHYKEVFRSLENQPFMVYLYHDKKMMDGKLKLPLLFRPGAIKIIDFGIYESQNILFAALDAVKKEI